jgi:hypothetical protein
MGLFWIVYWWLAALGSNSRFGGFNSRLSRQKFPFRQQREFPRKHLIYLAVSSTKVALTGRNRKNSRFYGNNRELCYGGSFEKMIVPEAANMPPTPWQTEILAPGIWAGAMPRIWRTLSCSAYMPYMPECM